MSNAIVAKDDEIISVLSSSLYPGASTQSIAMVLAYCRQAELDVMQKPVHIVPIWDSKAGQMRDVVMPGIGLYRTQAARSGECAGISEPEFGPDIVETLSGVPMTFPAWCKVTVRRTMKNGVVAEFSAVERWRENYATAKRDSEAPNAMWRRRPYAQLAKCAEAQALRKAFPEFGSAPTADEMEGKELNGEIDITPKSQAIPTPKNDDDTKRVIAELEKVMLSEGIDKYREAWKKLSKEMRAAVGTSEAQRIAEMGRVIDADQCGDGDD
jgi:phage recombination protein Bet